MDGWHLLPCMQPVWEAHWRTLSHGTLPQSWQYGTALCQTRWCQPRRFLVQDGEGDVRGVVQLLVRSLPGLGGAARLNRGPIFCGQPWSEAEQRLFLHALQRAARRYRWWYLRCAFEWLDSPAVAALLQENGWQWAQNSTAWGSHRLSLLPEVAILRRGLTGKWRNRLVKGEGQGVVVRVGVEGKPWQSLLDDYQTFQQEKGFVGLSPDLLHQLVKQDGASWRFHLLSAYLPTALDRPIGQLVTIHHGETATYLVGLTQREGRDLQVNYLLLWQAILLAKESRLAWFDLGGVNRETPEGITHFKSGVGGVPYLLIGEWRWHVFRS